MADLSPTDVLQKLAETVTDGAAKQYDDYSKTFVALDSKAQGTITAGGVLLGVIVTLANAGKLNTILKEGCLLAVLLPTAAAFIVMVLGVFAFRVAKVNVPFDVERQIREFNTLRDLKPSEKIEQQDLIGFHVQRHSQWSASLQSMATAVSRKGRIVYWAQIALLFAVALTVLLFGFIALEA